jgi:hypothetical protein
MPANDDPPAVAGVGAAEGALVAVGGAKAVSREAIRATTDSMLTPV